MNVFRETELGPEAIQYIRECLTEGKTLAHYLLQISALDKGTVFTFLPVDVSYEEAKNFRDGILPEPPPETHKYFTAADGTVMRMVPKPNTGDWLVGVIRMFLSSGEGRVCIFEDALAQPTDPWLAHYDGPVLTCEDEVYHFLSGRDIERDKIGEVVRHARSWLFIGAMTSVPQGIDFPSMAQTIARTELRRLAERAENIIVGAYDGEGYLIWHKP